MKYLFTMPCAVAVGLLVTRLLLEALHIPDSLLWNTLGTLVFAGFLFQRRLYELMLILALIALSKVGAGGDRPLGLAEDVWLSLVLAVIMLPVLERLMSIDRASRF